MKRRTRRRKVRRVQPARPCDDTVRVDWTLTEPRPADGPADAPGDARSAGGSPADPADRRATPRRRRTDGVGLKLLFVAFACEPGHGSEPGVGWNFVHEASMTRPVWLVCHESFRPGIEAYLRDRHDGHPIHVTYVGLPRPLARLWRSHWGTNVYYYAWQHVAARAAARLHASVGGFDLVQHVSFVRYWMPSAAGLFAARHGVPFVWGPVSGGEAMPSAFYDKWVSHSRAVEGLRTLAAWGWRCDPALRTTARAASVALAGTPDAVPRLRAMGVGRVGLMSAVAVAADRIGGVDATSAATAGDVPAAPTALDARKRPGVFRFVNCGRLLHWKGVHLGLRAFAEANLPDAEVVLCGDGAYRRELQALSRRLGIAGRVHFLGDLPYADCVRHVAAGDALLHPALRDSAGLTIEALSLGRPVLCLDIGTPAVLVDETSGLRAASASPDASVAEMAAAMRRWRTDAGEYRRLSDGARARAEAVSRPRRAAELERLYAEVLAGHRKPFDRPPVTARDPTGRATPEAGRTGGPARTLRPSAL